MITDHWSELHGTYVAVHNNYWHCNDADILGPLVSGWKSAPVCCQALGHSRAMHWALHCFTWALGTALYIALRALYFTLHLGHCTVHYNLATALYIELWALHCTLQFGLYIVHSTLGTLLYIAFLTPHFTMQNGHCLVHNTWELHCILHSMFSTMFNVPCIVRCSLNIEHFVHTHNSVWPFPLNIYTANSFLVPSLFMPLNTDFPPGLPPNLGSEGGVTLIPTSPPLASGYREVLARKQNNPLLWAGLWGEGWWVITC